MIDHRIFDLEINWGLFFLKRVENYSGRLVETSKIKSLKSKVLKAEQNWQKLQSKLLYKSRTTTPQLLLMLLAFFQ